MIDLSQNHVGDDTPDWADLYAAAAAAAAEKGAAAAAAGPGGAGGAAGPRNGVMREIDLSFNWVQVRLAFGSVWPRGVGMRCCVLPVCRAALPLCYCSMALP